MSRFHPMRFRWAALAGALSAGWGASVCAQTESENLVSGVPLDSAPTRPVSGGGVIITPVPECVDFLGGWRVVNGGAFIDYGETLRGESWVRNGITNVTTGNGDVVYFVPSTIGTVMGRFSTTKAWQIWTANGWSGAAGAVPDVVDSSIAYWGRLKAFKHPTQTTGFLGVTHNALREGQYVLDMHGMQSQFEFSNGQMKRWTGGSTYESTLARTVVASWNGSEMDFAYDPATRTGILVSGIGFWLSGMQSQLTATQYRYDDGAEKWHRWHRPSTEDTQGPSWGQPGFQWTGPGEWYANDNWPSIAYPDTVRKAIIFNHDVSSLNNLSYSAPRIVHITGTQDYLCTVGVTGAALPPDQNGNALKPIRYHGGASPVWQYWNGTTWTSGGNFALQGLGVADSQLREQFYWYGGKVVILYAGSAYTHTTLSEIVYDNATATFSTPRVLNDFEPPHNGGSPIASAVDACSRIWLAYTPDRHTVYIRHRDPGQDWTSPQAVFTSTDEIVPHSMTFLQKGTLPLVFCEQKQGSTNPTYRALAISPNTSYWNGEQTRTPTVPPDRRQVSRFELQFKERLANGRGDAFYGFTSPSSMGVDADGYIYSGRYGYCSIVTIPPNQPDWTNNHMWGSFWDLSTFPSGIAVDTIRQKVYATDRLQWGSGAGIDAASDVAVWDVAQRDTHIGCQHLGVPQIPYQCGYTPARIRRPDGSLFAWNTDVAVDALRGFLYVPDGARSRVLVYNISGATPTYLYSFGTEGTGPGQFRFPKGIDVDADGGVFVVDSQNHRVQHWALGSNGQQAYVSSFGAAGRGNGQLLYPVGLRCDRMHYRVYVSDPMNNRVCAFSTSGTFMFQFGKWWEVDSVHQTYNSIGLGVDNDGNLLMGSDSSIIRFAPYDVAPKLIVNKPSACHVLLPGDQEVTGETSDDYGMHYIDVSFTIHGVEVFHEQYRVSDGPFALPWQIPNGSPLGDIGILRVTAVDHFGHSRTIERRVWIGWVGNVSDADHDGLYDDCDNCPNVANPDQADCDGNGIGDRCENVPDCNLNGVPDNCDIESGYSTDYNHNGVPDDCEDCNHNGIPDELDISNGTSADCNNNGIPDSCDVASGTSRDCDGNGVLDECEEDCNMNGYRDSCDIASGRSQDCNLNGIPDECELGGICIAPPLDVHGGVYRVVTQDRTNGDIIAATDEGYVRFRHNGTSSATYLPGHVYFGAYGVAQDPVSGQILMSVYDWEQSVNTIVRVIGQYNAQPYAPAANWVDAIGIAVNTFTNDVAVLDRSVPGIVIVPPSGAPYVLATGPEFVDARSMCFDPSSGGYRLAVQNLILHVQSDGSLGNGIALRPPTVVRHVAYDPVRGDLLASINDDTIVRVGMNGGEEIVLHGRNYGAAGALCRDNLTGRWVAVAQGRLTYFTPVGDCNQDQIPDSCQFASGVVPDLDNDGVPDRCERLLGDCDCDGVFGFEDMFAFLEASSDPQAYAQHYPNCDIRNADMNCDGVIDEDDVTRFFACLEVGGCSCP